MKSLFLQLAKLLHHPLSRKPKDLKAKKERGGRGREEENKNKTPTSPIPNQHSSLIIQLKSTPPARMVQLLTLHLNEPKSYNSWKRNC